MWRPKTTAQWLLDFQNAVVLNKSSEKQSVHKKIEIVENGKLVASYEQIYQSDLTGEMPTAYLYAGEQFHTLGTTAFDIMDEYFLKDGTLFMKRMTDGEEIVSSFAASLDVFWETVSENIGKSAYCFEEANFSNLSILHQNGEHSMSADIQEDNKTAFFGKEIDALKISNVKVEVSLLDNLKLKNFTLTYDTKESDAAQSTNIEIIGQDFEGVFAPEWVKF